FLRDGNFGRALGMHQLRLTEPGLLALVVALLQGVCHGISHLRDLGLCLERRRAVWTPDRSALRRSRFRALRERAARTPSRQRHTRPFNNLLNAAATR